MVKLTTRFLFKQQICGAQGAAGTLLSDAQDIRDITDTGVLGFTYTIASTNGTAGAGTAGSSTFEYLISSTFDGSYFSPTGGTFGTQGIGAAQQGGISFTPVPAPFIKIKAVSGTSNPAVISGELHIR